MEIDRLMQIEKDYKRNLSKCVPKDIKISQGLYLLMIISITLVIAFVIFQIRISGTPTEVLLEAVLFLLIMTIGVSIIIFLIDATIKYPNIHIYQSSAKALDLLRSQGYTEEEIEEFKQFKIFSQSSKYEGVY